MSEPATDSGAGPAPSINTVAPAHVSPAAANSRLIIDAIQPTIAEIRSEIRSAEGKTDGHFKWLLVAFGGGFLTLAGMAIAGYLSLDAKIDAQGNQISSQIDSNYKDLDNKFESSQSTLIQVTTQLSDLLQRVPPVVEPIPAAK